MANRSRRLYVWLYGWISWLDYGFGLPLISRLKPQNAKWFVRVRGIFNFVFDLDWRTLSLRQGYVRSATLQAMRAICQLNGSKQSSWLLTLRRFVNASWEEYDSQRLSKIDYSTIAWHGSGMDALLAEVRSGQGVVLMTGHFDSLYIGLMLLAKQGVTVNLMSSSIVKDSRVPIAIQHHFKKKIVSMAEHFQPGKVINFEDGIKSFVSALKRGEIVVIACDGPAAAVGRSSTVQFLGGNFFMSGGPEFFARKTSSPISMFVCNRESDGRFRVDFSAPVRLEDGGLQRAYDFLAARIQSEPWRWWAADQWARLQAAPAIDLSTKPKLDEPAPNK